MKVLIIDDEALIRHSIKKMLEKHNYNIIGEAENGRIGAEKCKELNPDLITMDITMPEMDGLQALKTIREFNKDVKIVMISAMGQEATVQEAIKSGANNFIVKPIKEDFSINIINGLRRLFEEERN